MSKEPKEYFKLGGAIFLMVFSIVFLLMSINTSFNANCQLASVGSLSTPTTYYLDNSTGNDANSGTSLDKPWKTLAKISATKLNPGDQVLLKRGEVWNETMTLAGVGLAGSPIIIDAYGTGNLPEINGGGVRPATLVLNNPSYLTVKNLRLTNAGGTTDNGSINITYSSNVTLDSLTIDNNQNSGVGGLVPDYLTITNCQINNNGNRGIYLAYAQNTTISGNTVSNNGGKTADSYGIDLIGSKDNNLVQNNNVSGEKTSIGSYPNGSLRFDGDTVGDGKTNTAPANNKMVNNQVSGGQVGIQIINFSNAQILNNVINGTTLYGILIQAQPNGGVATNTIMSGNTIAPASGDKAIYWNAGVTSSINYTGTSCTENWSCSTWGSCTNNSQTRSCTDANNCGTTINKPATTQACTACTPKTWYRDADNDGYGDPKVTVSSCSQPVGYISDSRDCNGSVRATRYCANCVRLLGNSTCHK